MIPADRLLAVRTAVDRACRTASRPDRPILIAVSKTRTVDEIEALIVAGQRDFGESRVQEALEKWPALRQRHPDVRLHMIGRLQSNKAEDAANLFDAIHSLDRTSLLEALVAAGTKTGSWPHVFVQVNVGDESQKGGIALQELPAFLEQVRRTPLPLAGLMAIPPVDAQAGPYFALLAKLAAAHALPGLSMGMSADYPTATMLGSTHLRVGSALFED
jgi:pyridoxal phosphate enzyme (YggS family)